MNVHTHTSATAFAALVTSVVVLLPAPGQPQKFSGGLVLADLPGYRLLTTSSLDGIPGVKSGMRASFARAVPGPKGEKGGYLLTYLHTRSASTTDAQTTLKHLLERPVAIAWKDTLATKPTPATDDLYVYRAKDAGSASYQVYARKGIIVWSFNVQPGGHQRGKAIPDAEVRLIDKAVRSLLARGARKP